MYSISKWYSYDLYDFNECSILERLFLYGINLTISTTYLQLEQALWKVGSTEYDTSRLKYIRKSVQNDKSDEITVVQLHSLLT